MKATDPTLFIEKIDIERWNQLRRHKAIDDTPNAEIIYVEPAGDSEEAVEAHTQEAAVQKVVTMSEKSTAPIIVGKVQRLGDMIDTDAVSWPCFLHFTML